MAYITSTQIQIKDLKIYARHGVLPQERTVGAYFIINLNVDADIAAAMASDDLADTISYADMLELVRREMATPSKLLEHVAARIARAILDRFPQAAAVDIDIMKQNPPMGADCAGAGVRTRITR